MNDIEKLKRITKKIVDSRTKDYLTFLVRISSGGNIVIEYTRLDKYGRIRLGDTIYINEEDNSDND